MDCRSEKRLADPLVRSFDNLRKLLLRQERNCI